MSKTIVVVTIVLLSFLSLSSLYDLVLGTTQPYTGYIFLVSGGLALGLIPQLSKKERKAKIEKIVKKQTKKQTKKGKIRVKKGKETIPQEEAQEISEKKVEWIGASGLDQIESQE